ALPIVRRADRLGNRAGDSRPQASCTADHLTKRLDEVAADPLAATTDVLVVSANGDPGLSRLLGKGLTERLSRCRTGLVRIRRHAGGEEVPGEAVHPRLETLRKSVSRRSADQLRFILDLGSV